MYFWYHLPNERQKKRTDCSCLQNLQLIAGNMLSLLLLLLFLFFSEKKKQRTFCLGEHSWQIAPLQPRARPKSRPITFSMLLRPHLHLCVLVNSSFGPFQPRSTKKKKNAPSSSIIICIRHKTTKQEKKRHTVNSRRQPAQQGWQNSIFTQKKKTIRRHRSWGGGVTG